MGIAMESKPKVYVAGSTGMVGSAICRRLVQGGYSVLEGPKPRPDLRDPAAVQSLLVELKPDWIFLAAAHVGGIHANSTYPAQFIYDNLMIQANVIHTAYLVGVKKLLFLGSSCIYPGLSPQPMKEEYLLTGYPEATNRAYAVAKIAGIVMAQSYNQQYGTNFISVMPTNLYGRNDHFDLENSHVVPALMRKTHEAKRSRAPFVEVWGSGNPKREFLHVDDVADACLFLMENYDSGDIINIGSGNDISIRELALLMAEVVGFTGEIRFDSSKPDGMPRKWLDVTRLTELGWTPSISLKDGLASTYQWYLEHEEAILKNDVRVP
jgi:GDP-L-fucose synthase